MQAGVVNGTGSNTGWTASKSNSCVPKSHLSGGPYASLLKEDKKRQEELDKLLAGLDKLTETLPDLTLTPPPPPPKTEPDSNVRPSQVVSTLKRSANMANIATETAAMPYHTRTDSKPFSYIRTNKGQSAPGLQSPGLLRKIMNGSEASNNSSRAVTPVNFQQNLQQQRQQNYSVELNVTPIAVSHKTIQVNDHKSSLIKDMDCTDQEASLSWLQKQQRKLQDRRENQRRRESKETMKELKTSLNLVKPPEPIEPPPRTFDVVATISPKTSTPKAGGIPLSATMTMLQRQKSDSSFDRSRPLLRSRLRHESESEMSDVFTTTTYFRNQPSLGGSITSVDSSMIYGMNGTNSLPGSRPITPGFPSTAPTTPYFNHSANNFNILQQRINSCTKFSNGQQRSASPMGGGTLSLYTASRRGSISSTATSEPPAEVPAHFVKRAKDSHKYWYKPNISREEAIAMIQDQPPGAFVVRNSNSFPGAFGLALKVATPPVGSGSDELVRHFLIEPTKKGVKLKGYANEPVFGSLSALIYQHTVMPMALPQILVLPEVDLMPDAVDSGSLQMQQLLQVGAACNVLYLFTMDTDTLTGPTALQKAVSQLMTLKANNAAPVSQMATCVHFKVSSQGITLTDNARRLFFRKHYPTHSVSFCNIDPDDRKWKSGKGEAPARIFGFVARKPTSRSGHNQCHLFAEQDPDQPARAIVNFVNKVLVSVGSRSRSLSASAGRSSTSGSGAV